MKDRKARSMVTARPLVITNGKRLKALVLGNHPDNARKKASLEVAELPASITEF